MKLFTTAALAALLLSSTAALAGQPTSPGAGGQGVKALVENERSGGNNLGQSLVKPYVHDNDNPPGQFLQDELKGEDGSPNPGNDNGSGND